MALCRHLPYHNKPLVHNRINVTGINRNRLKFVFRARQTLRCDLSETWQEVDVERLSSIYHLPGALNLITSAWSFFPFMSPSNETANDQHLSNSPSRSENGFFCSCLIASLMKSLHRWSQISTWYFPHSIAAWAQVCVPAD